MKKRIIKIALSTYIMVQIITMILLIIDEIRLIQNGLEYRFQYLLILYIIIPALIIGGIIEYFGFKKLTKRRSKLMLFPFLVAIGFSLTMTFEGKSNPITLSYYVTLVELIAILMFGYSFLKVIKQKTDIDHH